MGLDHTAGWVAEELRWLVAARGFMFAWNLLLAFVPLALATILFRRGARHTLAWWAGLVAFVLFLPNAAYVLTDVVHLLDDVRAGTSDLALVTVYGPVYGIFFAVGFSCYALSLVRLGDHVRDAGVRGWWAMELAIHALAAVGIYLGRVLRFNSWDIVQSPGALTDSVPQLATRFPLLFVAFTFVALVVLTAIAKPALRAALGWSARLAGRALPRGTVPLT